MSISVVQRLFAFFDNVWSFILTLVRSLLALFSFRRRSADPFALPRVNRTPKDALARAHTHLRPILLTQRSITLPPTHYPQRSLSTRTRSAASTLFPGHGECTAASGSVSLPTGPQRTSPKLDPHDPELGFAVAVAVAGPTGATGVPEGTPDTSSLTTHTGSLSTLPLTPPDRCYLAPIPSAVNCPYTESWPSNVVGKPRLTGSPLKISISTEAEPMVGPMGSPPPGHWSPVQIWTSTPCKNDSLVPDPAFNLFDHRTQSTADPGSALSDISHALISRSRNSIHPYDDTSNSSTSSSASLIVNHSNGPTPGTLPLPGPTREPHRTQVQVARHKNQPHPQFHYPDAYTWRHHAGRVPGKSDRATRVHGYSRSYSHANLPMCEWYDTGAYAPSPIYALSPPLGDSATEDEDEDEVPLGRLRDRIAHRNGGVGTGIGLGVPISAGVCKAPVSPRTRRKSEGCLLALYESTPTRVGVGARSVLALTTNEHSPKDWLEALSLRFYPEQRDALGPGPTPP